ncbi:hypothetical protein [Clostridium felsineum]|uniref:hypothetical protein n=1 Tax=Clostridium felsineum TaxID=36839 RepID=UPI00098C6352|nr:hypothetical protein [Clostridium felsineum]URZ18572.1 hypothetical protein CLFE_046600 [Clostridium felsineum DSM 794]
MKKDEILFLMKFGKKDNLEKLQKGNFYTKNLKYYIECERQGGQGDENEAALILNKTKIEARNPDTNEIIFVSDSSKVTFRKDNDKYVPVFCMRYSDSTDLQNIREENGIITAQLKFSKDKGDYLKKEFGEYVLIISPVDFWNRIIEKMQEQTKIVMRKVKYEDLSINDAERMKNFANDTDDRFFVKDNLFETQKEYRIAFTDIQVNDSFEKNIGSIQQFTHLLNVDDLVNKGMGIKYKSIKAD